MKCFLSVTFIDNRTKKWVDNVNRKQRGNLMAVLNFWRVALWRTTGNFSLLPSGTLQEQYMKK